MGLKVTNNAFGTLNAGINSSATTIVLTAGQGARFPTLSAGDYFYATLIDTANNLEIVKVTARSTDTMTIVRAQDNTTARAYSTNDRFELRPTAALFNEVITKADTAQTTADAALPKAGGTMTGVLTRQVSSSTGVETSIVDLVDSGGNRLGKITSYNDGSYNQDLKVYTTNAAGDNQRLVKTIRGATLSEIYVAPRYGIWTETMQTPNGGSQTVRVIEDIYGRWILVGRFKANAAAEIVGTWSSVRGLSTSLAQDVTTAFSADFGDSFPSEVRVLGATDFAKWRDTRTVDFVYKVPSGRTWKTFFNGGNTNGTYMTGGVARKGFTTNGTYDGFGRWGNANNTQIGMSDSDYTNPDTAYTTPTSGAFNWNTAGDAKLTAIHTGVYSGQDGTWTTGFGHDDNDDFFQDSYPNTVGQGSAGMDYSSSVWVLLKFN